MYQTSIEVLNSLPEGFLESLAGVFFVALIGKFTRAELRLLLAAVAGCVAYPHPATLFGVGILGLILKGFDFVWTPVHGEGG